MRYSEKDPHRYDDMLDLPHHQSVRHAHMPMEERAAQFSPFAALTGFDAELEESARRTGSRKELTDEVKQELDQALSQLQSLEKERPLITLTHFVPDLRKEGGEYQTEEVRLKRIDTYHQALQLTDGRMIALENIDRIKNDTK